MEKYTKEELLTLMNAAHGDELLENVSGGKINDDGCLLKALKSGRTLEEARAICSDY